MANPRNFVDDLRAEGFIFRNTPKMGLRVINKTGSSIAKDKLVAVTGYDTTAKRPKVVLADADVAGHDDVWVTNAAIANNVEGYVFKGLVSAANLDTNAAATAGDPVFLNTTAGGFTVTAPTATAARVVEVGSVIVKSATVGQIFWNIRGSRRPSSLDAANSFGYGVGQGGTVTQATNKSTGVTLNTLTGEITMNGASLAADTTVAFTLTNTTIALGDYVLVQHISAGTQAAYITTALAAAGSATVNVHNATAGALAEAIVLKFVVIKSATT